MCQFLTMHNTSRTKPGQDANGFSCLIQLQKKLIGLIVIESHSLQGKLLKCSNFMYLIDNMKNFTN